MSYLFALRHGLMAGVLVVAGNAAAAQQPPAPSGQPAPAPGEQQAPAPTGQPAPTPGGQATPMSLPEATTEPREQLVISLDEAVRRALAQNPTLDEASAAVRRAEAVVAEVRSFLRPRLDGSIQYTVQGPIPTFTLTTPSPTPGGQPTTQEIPFGKTLTRNFALSATYNPDLFGRIRSQREAASRQVRVTQGSLLNVQNELVFAVQNVYLAALRAQELIGVQQEALAAAQEQLRVADAQFRAGLAPEFDVLRARVQVENVRQNLVAAEATFRRTTASLAALLSLEPTTGVALTPVAVPPETDAVVTSTARQVLDPTASETLPPPPDTLEEALSEAFNRRPEVYREEWARRAAQSLVEFERKGRLPTLNLSASGFYNPDVTGLAAVERSWSIVAFLSIPIWDAGLSRARTEQARADVQAASARLESAKDTVTEEVKQALVDLETSQDRRRTAAANTEQAREALRIARVRYAAGLAPNVEVTDAEAALTQARANEVNAAYDYLAALASLNRSLGLYADNTLTAMRREGRAPSEEIR